MKNRKLPIGAELSSSKEGAHFRVWAPKPGKIALIIERNNAVDSGAPLEWEMNAEEGGYFSCFVPHARAGMLYRFRLNDDDYLYPDPASRAQPQGPHGPSQLIDPTSYNWNDADWEGIPERGRVLYEMHIGTFTVDGTFRAAAEQLSELAALGITVIEVMPVAEFDGKFGWGYDGVSLFAPYHYYGSPDDFRFFVDRAHAVGIGVILDVVYNHFGPSGCYHRQFSDAYFSESYQCEWGDALNFDGEQAGPVREFFISNAGYWIDEFHLDGLRLDATQQIFDASEEHVISEITCCVRNAANGRSVYIVAENEPQQARIVRTERDNGYGCDALWNDDFHHAAIVALKGHTEAYLVDYKGSPQEFISAVKSGFLYQGQWYRWQKKRRGTPSRHLAPDVFINYLQNHDQIANSGLGKRIHQLSAPGMFRAMTALLLLGPATPMLFQGQEFCASAPFLYFADHNTELAALVSHGRTEFLHQFPSLAALETQPYLAQPHSPLTFQRCKLDFSEREQHCNAYALHQDLLKLRSTDPVFSTSRRGGVDGAVLSDNAFVLRFFSQNNEEDRLLIVNFGHDLSLSPAPEPLLAPHPGCDWQLLWSSEHPRYGGHGTPPVRTSDEWRVPGMASIVLIPIPSDEKENNYAR
jgi:maltooligosyltrehalose trehalohydrolase